MPTYKVLVQLSRLQHREVEYFVDMESSQEAKDEAHTLALDEFGATWDSIQIQPRHVELAQDDE